MRYKKKKDGGGPTNSALFANTKHYWCLFIAIILALNFFTAEAQTYNGGEYNAGGEYCTPRQVGRSCTGESNNDACSSIEYSSSRSSSWTSYTYGKVVAGTSFSCPSNTYKSSQGVCSTCTNGYSFSVQSKTACSSSFLNYELLEDEKCYSCPTGFKCPDRNIDNASPTDAGEYLSSNTFSNYPADSFCVEGVIDEVIGQTPSLNYAMGSVAGAFVGDAAGAVLEFIGRDITEDDVENALTFPGGGVFEWGKGELTDDSEMALSLLNSLLETKGEVSAMNLAQHYYKWGISPPKDMGITIGTALTQMREFIKNKNESKLFAQIDQLNAKSKSNGCLMRATPLSVFCHGKSIEEIYNLTSIDVKMTHSNPTCIHAVVCYNIAIAHLVDNHGDKDGAVQKVQEYIEGLKDCQDLKDNWSKLITEDDYANLICPTKNIGYVMIAFTYAFHFLHKDFSYEDAIRKTLFLNGDTDTNAAIVGGLLGAYHGYKKIPAEWKDKVLNAEITDRPDYLSLHGEEDLYTKINTLYHFSVQ